MLGERGKAFLVDGMKPAMETAAEENTEQSQERKGTQRSDNSLFPAFHWGAFKGVARFCVSWKIALKQSLWHGLAFRVVFACRLMLN